MHKKTIAKKVSEFAVAHPNAVVCAMHQRRPAARLTHVYYVVKDGQATRIPAGAYIGNGVPRYVLDLEHGCHWREYTGDDVRRRFERVFSTGSYTDGAYYDFIIECAGLAARLNRWLKAACLAEFERKIR